MISVPGKINCVIGKDISRLGRHFVMTSEYVEKVFPTMNVRLICINDDFDSFDGDIAFCGVAFAVQNGNE